MGGFFGVASTGSCVRDVFYGTDYHSHLGTEFAGLAFWNTKGFTRAIHSITDTPFRSRFEPGLGKMHGHLGLGVISDTDPQPLAIGSHLGRFAIVTVGVIKNMRALVQAAYRAGERLEMSGQGVTPTEIAAALINHGQSFEAGIAMAQDRIEGSCSMLLLTKHGIYAARDKRGRTPVILGKKEGAWAVTLETCAFPNLGFETAYELGPGEIIFLTAQGFEQLKTPEPVERICAFLWVYFGFPASSYNGLGVEEARNRCGIALAKREDVQVDLVAGIPDSGTGHAIGFTNYSGTPYARPFAKYTPTWPRSFMPPNQDLRNLVARMKLIPIRKLVAGKRLLFCEDSIVRGTQLQRTIELLFQCGAAEVHMRPACPPLIHGCRFLNFSRSRSEKELAGRKAIIQIEGQDPENLSRYADHTTEEYRAMVEGVRQQLGLTSLRYQTLPDLVEAIGLPKCRLCTYCWDGIG